MHRCLRSGLRAARQSGSIQTSETRRSMRLVEQMCPVQRRRSPASVQCSNRPAVSVPEALQVRLLAGPRRWRQDVRPGCCCGCEHCWVHLMVAPAVAHEGRTDTGGIPKPQKAALRTTAGSRGLEGASCLVSAQPPLPLSRRVTGREAMVTTPVRDSWSGGGMTDDEAQARQCALASSPSQPLTARPEHFRIQIRILATVAWRHAAVPGATQARHCWCLRAAAAQ